MLAVLQKNIMIPTDVLESISSSQKSSPVDIPIDTSSLLNTYAHC
jgi:hypothetical protein